MRMRGFALPLVIASLAVVSEAEPVARLSSARLHASRGKLIELSHKSLLFELFLPSDWHSGGSFPVITFLHGRGESGGFDVTNAQSLPLQLLSNASAAAAPFIVIVPQCPIQCMHHNGWLPSVLQDVSALLHEWVVPTLGGDATRLYLTGQSMGGHGAWMYSSQQPRLFAAVVVVCGYAQGSDEATSVAARLAKQKLAVAIYHSADDSVIPVNAADQMAAALRSSGYTDEEEGLRRLRFVRYTTAPGPPMPEFAHLTGHGSYELVFRDHAFYAWLLRQHCQKCSRPTAPWLPLEAGVLV